MKLPRELASKVVDVLTSLMEKIPPETRKKVVNAIATQAKIRKIPSEVIKYASSDSGKTAVTIGTAAWLGYDVLSTLAGDPDWEVLVKDPEYGDHIREIVEQTVAKARTQRAEGPVDGVVRAHVEEGDEERVDGPIFGEKQLRLLADVDQACADLRNVLSHYGYTNRYVSQADVQRALDLKRALTLFLDLEDGELAALMNSRSFAA